MLHIKFDIDWLAGLRDIYDQKCKYTEFELVRDFMPVLVTNMFDEDPLKMNVLAWRHHFNFLDGRWHLTPVGVVRSGQNSSSSEILCLSFFESLPKIGLKLKALTWRHRFPIIIQWEFLLS